MDVNHVKISRGLGHKAKKWPRDDVTTGPLGGEVVDGVAALPMRHIRHDRKMATTPFTVGRDDGYVVTTGRECSGESAYGRLRSTGTKSKVGDDLKNSHAGQLGCGSLTFMRDNARPTVLAHREPKDEPSWSGR